MVISQIGVFGHMRSRLLSSAVLLLFSMSASAGLIKETYESTVTGVLDVVGVAISDTFTWSVTFDDLSRSSAQYNDGVNGDGENGGGDDTLFRKLCLDGAAGGPGCVSFVYSSTFLQRIVY